MPHVSHYDKWGYFHADRHGLIGHDSADVAKWIEAHPEFTPEVGSIWFDYGNGEDWTECTEFFFPEADEAIELEVAA